jgi:hypothetical protein
MNDTITKAAASTMSNSPEERFGRLEARLSVEGVSMVPSSREIPNPKFQIPNRLEFGAWSLEFVWNLVLGVWNFPEGIGCDFPHPTGKFPTLGYKLVAPLLVAPSLVIAFPLATSD